MKTSTLIDSNILIDVWGPPDTMTAWSKLALTASSLDGSLLVNPIVWAELAPLIDEEAELAEAAASLGIEREALPWHAAFLAGRTHSRYRQRGGSRERTLPDFLIGAHASVAGYRLLTRDPARYRSYFPDLEIIAPDTHP